MKITTKTTKEAMKEFLKDNLTVVTDDLKDRVQYALDATEDKLTRKDLVDLVKEVNKVVPKTAEPKAENSLKKPVKKEAPAKKEAPKTEVVEAEAPVEEKPKKKVSSKKNAVKSASVSKYSTEYAEMFPATLVDIELGGEVRNFELASDIKTMEDLHKALSKDEVIIFAFYWSKRNLRQFPYFDGLLGQPKSFDNDLDIAMAIYCSEEFKVAYALSVTTEAPYTLLPDDLIEEDGIRISTGTEYQIYREVK